MNYTHTCTDIQRVFKCKIHLIHTLMKAFHINVYCFLQCLASCPKYYLPLLWTDSPSHSYLSWSLHRRNSSSYYGKTICKFMYQHFGGRCSMNCKSQTSSNIYIFRNQMWFFFQIDNNAIYLSICLLVFPVIRLISHFE